MTKRDYAKKILDKVDEMLEDIGLWEEYEISTANEANDRTPILLVEFPDENTRVYDIPYDVNIVGRIQSLDASENINFTEMLDFCSSINNFINTIKAEVEAYEAEYNEDENENTDFEEEAEWSRGRVAEDYEEDDEEVEEENSEKYHTEDWYRDYDTDYAYEFEITARQWIIDNKDKLTDEEIDDIFSVIDFADLNQQYQNNDLDFVDTMWNEMDSLGLRRPIQPQETVNTHSDNDTNRVSNAEIRQIIREMTQILSRFEDMISNDNDLEDDFEVGF